MATSALYDAAIGDYDVFQITNLNYNPGFVVAQHHYSGGVSPQQSEINYGDPVVTITSGDLAGFITNVNALSGLAITSGSVIFYQNDRAAGGVFAAEGNAHSISFTDGLLIPMDISASQDNEDGAQVTMEFHGASSTGLANPATYAASVTPPAQTFTNIYDLGPLKYNSTTIDGITDTKVNFGINVNKKRYSGFPFATMFGLTINEVRPSIDVTFEDQAAAYSFANFVAISGTCIAYYRDRAVGGTRVANATTSHVACTLTGGLAVATGMSASGRDNNAFTVTVSGHTLAMASNSAIS